MPLYLSTDRYSFRPYFPSSGRMQLKLTVYRHGEYVLVHDPAGRHYEEFVSLAKEDEVVAAIKRAMNGTLGGHQPVNPAVSLPPANTSSVPVAVSATATP